MSQVASSSLDDPRPGAPRPGSGAMFDRIAGRYDFLNRLISLGLDRGWRRHLVRAVEPKRGGRYLDLATGTADVALEMLSQNPGIEAVGLDPSSEMLAIGRRKVDALGTTGQAIELVEGKAEQLPWDDDHFDGVTISFGIRNVADRPAALAEMARVTRAGGRVAILEGNEPRGTLLAPFARFHLHVVIPWIGRLFSGGQEYRYLQTSIQDFPPADEFAELMGRCGLEVLEVRKLNFGTLCLYVAEPAKGVRS